MPNTYTCPLPGTLQTLAGGQSILSQCVHEVDGGQ